VPIAGITVELVTAPDWPGDPVVMVVDDQVAVIAARVGDRMSGHFGANPTFVAAALKSLDALREGR
jgi:hypothetical protein